MTGDSKDSNLRFNRIIYEYAATVSSTHPSIPALGSYAWKLQRDTLTSVARYARRFAIRYPMYMYVILTVVSIGVTFFLIARQFPDGFVNFTGYVGGVGLSIGAYQAWISSVGRQADKVNAIFSNLIENQDFYQTWFELFYSYENDTFNQVHTHLKSRIRDNLENHRPRDDGIDFYTDLLSELNLGKAEGSRCWHPLILPGSKEEARIDALLSYLNLIGDLYERGSLSRGEIGDAAEYYLMAVGNSNAFRAYLYEIRKVFAGEQPYGIATHGSKSSRAHRLELPGNNFAAKFGTPPYRHLCLLLYDLAQARPEKDRRIYGRFNITAQTDPSDVDISPDEHDPGRHARESGSDRRSADERSGESFG